ncbi:MAG: ribonuclease R [Sporomusaceae bacterium]|nr:ribonuclease R [Sporomusaceae bacterium]
MNLTERILTFMNHEAYKPLAAEDLADQLALDGEALQEFWQVLERLEQSAQVIKTRFDKYGVPQRMNLMVGRLEMTRKGAGFVISEIPDLPDVHIAPHALNGAMNHDRVVARIHGGKIIGRAQEGEIIRIVTRANSSIVGTFEARRHYGFVTPDDKRIGYDIFIPQEEFHGAENGQKVVATINKWPDKGRSAEGSVSEILGSPGDVGIEILSVIKKHNLPVDFPEEVKAAAEQAPSQISPDELAGRRDLRQRTIVTIDGEDAKDLDDAVEVERLSGGRYRLGVHIADVSYYVTEDSILDQEARERGTSVYLVDRVLPMLPRRLSNGICSLNAGEDRLAMSCEMEISPDGKVLTYEIFPSVIHVTKRMTYTIVRKILAEQDESLRLEYQEFVPHFEEMERLCLILRNRRMRRGAIDFDFPEIKVKLDEAGHPVEIVKRVRSIAESIVEEFMLVANETVAEHMVRRKLPFVYRVHEEPEPEKIAKLNGLLHNFGQAIATTGEVKPLALQQVLSNIAGQPEERIISTVMLRSLKQARYEAENLGHFGLAASYYTHFTSPIRRYPDLIVHRLLRETFQGKSLTPQRKDALLKLLPEWAHHCSLRERAAADAERETVDLKKVEYMAQFVDEEFPGFISGVTAFGLFVELANGIEGLVHVSTMDDDYYQYLEERYMLLGERTRKQYRLGDPVQIKLVKVNPEERSIDFILLAGEGEGLTPRFKADRPVFLKKGRGDSRGSGKNKKFGRGKDSRGQDDRSRTGKDTTVSRTHVPGDSSVYVLSSDKKTAKQNGRTTSSKGKTGKIAKTAPLAKPVTQKENAWYDPIAAKAKRAKKKRSKSKAARQKKRQSFEG